MSRTERFDNVGRTNTPVPSVEDAAEMKEEPMSDDETGNTVSISISYNDLDHLLEIKDEILDANNDQFRNQPPTVEDPDPSQLADPEPEKPPLFQSAPKSKTHLIQGKYQSSPIMNEVQDRISSKFLEQEKVKSPPSLLKIMGPPKVKLASNAPQANVARQTNSLENQPVVLESIERPYKSRPVESERENPVAESFISRLLSNNGGKGWTDEQIDLFVSRGRPFPKIVATEPRLQLLKTHYDYLLKKSSWLTAVVQMNKYFCWPCLIFARDRERWRLNMEITPKHTLQKINRALENHQNSLSHMRAHVQLKLRENALKKALPPEDDVNDVIRLNRRLLVLLFQVTCTMKKKIDVSNSEFDGYAALMRLVSSYDKELSTFLKESGSEKDLAEEFVSKYAQHAVLSIEAALKAQIISELSKTEHVAVILEDTCDFVDFTWVAVIIRHVDNEGEIRERFVQFIELGRDRSARRIMDNFKALMTDLGLERKLVGFTYSGTVVAPKDIVAFNAEVTKTYPSSKFFHYHEHSLMRLLIQAMSHVKCCQSFLKILADMVTFFETHPNAMSALMSIEREIPSTENKCPPDADFRSRLLSIVKNQYAPVLEFFEEISKSPNAWGSVEITEASSFLVALKILTNRFLICTVDQILVGIKDLADVIEKTDDLQEWKLSSKKCIATLNNIRKYGFEDLSQKASSSSLAGGSLMSSRELISKQLVETFYDCMNVVTKFITQYFKDIEFSFFDPNTVAVSTVFKADRRKVAATRLNLVTEELDKLIAQMDFLQKDALFKGKSSNEALKFIISHDMTGPLSEAVKFLRIQCTIPTKETRLVPSTISKLREYTRQKKNLKSADALIWMERDLLTTMQEEPTFYDHLIDVHFLNQKHADLSSFIFKTKSDPKKEN